MPAAEEEQKSTLTPAKDIFSWVSPARPFKIRNRQFYITVFAIAGIVGIVLFLAEGFMPVILIISLIFLFYVMNTVPPENIEYKITSKGITIAGRVTEWNLLTRFWFTKRFDNELLVIETLNLPGRLELVIKPEDKETIKKELAKKIPEEEAAASVIDRASNWLARRLPGY